MATASEARGQPGAVERRFHERAANAAALWVEIVRAPIHGEPVIGEGATAPQSEPHEQHRLRSLPTVLGQRLRVEDLEAVARPQLALEIDGETERPDGLDDQQRRHARPLGIQIEAVGDPATRIGIDEARRHGHRLRHISLLIIGRHDETPLRRRTVDQRLQPGSLRPSFLIAQHKAEGDAGAQAPRIRKLREGPHDRQRVRRRQPLPTQQIDQRLAAPQPHRPLL